MRIIGLHYFAYLHGVAEGLDIAACAERYLVAGHGGGACSPHQQTVDIARVIARRRSELWRPMGLTIKTTGMPQPILEAFLSFRHASR